MSRSAIIIPQLKELIGRGLDQAIKRIEELLLPSATGYNMFVQVKGRYSNYLSNVALGMVGQKDLDQQYAQLANALLFVIDGIQDSDLKPNDEIKPVSDPRRGELLYQIPRKMMEMKEYRCAVRVAYLKNVIMDDWEASADDVQRDVRVAEVMAVELVNVLEDEPFQIRALSSALQFLDENDYTEWIFMVKAKRDGEFPLALKISVVEVRNGREVKKDVVLEEHITVASEEEIPQKFKGSGYEIALGEQALPEAERSQPGSKVIPEAAQPSAVVSPSPAPLPQPAPSTMQKSSGQNKNIRSMALFLAFIMLGSISTWAFVPADKRDWVLTRYVQDDEQSYAAFAEKYPKSEYAEKAIFRKAIKSDKPRDYLAYQEKYPDGSYAKEVGIKVRSLEARQLEIITTHATPENVRQFVADFPQSERLPEVVQKIERHPELRAKVMDELEDASIAQVRKDPNARTVKNFLRSFPTSTKVSEVRERLDTMPTLREAVKQDLEEASFQQVKQTEDIVPAQEFLEEFPESQRREEVKKMMEERRDTRKTSRPIKQRIDHQRSKEK